MKLPQKVKHCSYIWSWTLASWYVSKRNDSWISKKHIHTHVHGSIFHNRQEEETKLTSTCGPGIKKLAYIHTAEFIESFKEENLIIGYTVDEPWKHYARQSKSVAKRNTAMVSIMRAPEVVKLGNTRMNGGWRQREYKGKLPVQRVPRFSFTRWKTSSNVLHTHTPIADTTLHTKRVM